MKLQAVLNLNSFEKINKRIPMKFIKINNSKKYFKKRILSFSFLTMLYRTRKKSLNQILLNLNFVHKKNN